MQPGEAIFLLNYEDICFVMKDWPRPGTSTSTIQTRTPVPSQCHSGCGIQRSLALCNPCSTGNCRRVAPVFFFFPLRFVLFCVPLLLCSLLRICCTVVSPSCHEDDVDVGAGGGGGGVRFQFGAAGRSSKQRIVNFAFVWSLH